jgi:hypothetical protein
VQDARIEQLVEFVGSNFSEHLLIIAYEPTPYVAMQTSHSDGEKRPRNFLLGVVREAHASHNQNIPEAK